MRCALLSLVFIFQLSFSYKLMGQYCIPTSTYGPFYRTNIDGVLLGDINNTNNGYNDNVNYVDYTNLSTDLIYGQNYSIEITCGTYYTNCYAYAWIDYNGDNDFQDAGEALGSILFTSVLQTKTISFSIPENYKSGYTRLRIDLVYNVSNYTPCTSYAYGETEDYTVNLSTDFVESAQAFVGITNPFSIADSDTDGDMDIYLKDRIYENSAGTFTQVPSDISGYYQNGQDWDDFDNDGDVDIIITSATGVGMTKVYQNNGANSFSFLDLGLDQVGYGPGKWIDLNNDGKKDIIVLGNDGLSFESVIHTYLNNGDLTFVEVELGIKEADEAHITIGDYNADGYMDFIICGRDINGNLYTALYKNLGELVFEEINTSIPFVNNGFLDWGDYDLDGDLDLLLNGNTLSGEYVLKIYENLGNDVFEDVNAGMQGMSRGCCRWGDYNNDGYLDVASVGKYYDAGWHRSALIYKNNGNGTFTEIENISSAGAEDGYLDWVDIDKDGDLDLMISGMAPGDIEFAKIFVNNTNKTNSTPTVPEGFSYSTIGNEVTLTWNKSNDNESGVGGLNYNICIGTASGLYDVVRPNANISTGNLLIQSMGNCNKNNFFKISGLESGTYYYKVQAVDEVFGTSSFSSEQMFFVKSLFSESEISTITTNKLNSNIRIADVDLDQDLDFVLDNEYSETGLLLYINDNEKLLFNNSLGFDLSDCEFDWGDYDNDGDIDLLAIGRFRVSNDKVVDTTLIFENLGSWKFDVHNFGLMRISRGSCQWADWDNDGDLDIILVGGYYSSSSNSGVFLYENLGSSRFSYDGSLASGSFDYPSSSVGDLDGDGYLDLVVAEKNESTIFFNKSGEFQAVDFSAGSLSAGSTSMGDYDNDGDTDLLICGRDSVGNKFTRIMNNNGEGLFIVDEQNIRGITLGKAHWIDIDNDNDLDIILAGISGVPITKIYVKENDTYSEMEIKLSATNSSGNAYCFDVGDMNGDGNADFISNVWDDYDGIILSLFTNNGNYDFSKLEKPTELMTERLGYGVRLNWTSLDEKGVTYNVRVATKGNSIDVVSPMSDIVTGFRHVPERGNASTNTFFILDTLPNGDYEWSVQAISAGMLGGEWSTVEEFTVKQVRTLFSADTVCLGTQTTFVDESFAVGAIVDKWDWDFGDGTSDSHQNPKHEYKNPGYYAVVLNACSGKECETFTKEIYVKPIPIADFAVENVCAGELVFVSDKSIIDTLEMDTWVWDFGDGSTFLGNNPGSHNYPVGNYTITLATTAKNSCQSQKSILVKVADYPSSIISTSKTPIFCKGDSIALSVPDNGLYTYQWLVEDVLQTGLNSSQVFVASQGNYKARVIPEVAKCASTSLNAVFVKVNAKPAPPLIYVEGDTEVCAGTQIILKTSEIPNHSYQWYSGSNGIGSDTSSIVIENSGKYSLVLLNNENNCSNYSNDSINVIVHPLPTIPSIKNELPTKFCQGDSVILFVASNASYTYQWKNGNGVISNATSNELVVKTTGDYYLEISNQNGCKVTTEPVSVTVLPSPNNPFIDALGDTIVCPGDSVLLTTVNYPQLSYEWFNSDVFVSNSPTLTAVNQGLYSLNVTDTNGCDAVSKNSIVVKNYPVAKKPIIDFDATLFCQGDSLQLTTDEVIGSEARWYLNNQMVLAKETVLQAKIEGQYYLELIDENGCPGQSKPLNISTIPIPNPVPINPQGASICKGESQELSVTAQSGVSYQWYKDGSKLEGEIFDNTTVNEPGNYSLKINNNNNCSYTPNSVNIKVSAMPLAQEIITEGNTYICPGEQVKLYVADNAQYRYQWNLNGDLIADATQSTYIAENEGKYTAIISNIENAACFISLAGKDITYKPSLPKPTLLAEGPNVWILACDNANAQTYQWYYNGDLISEATEHIYVANQNLGEYYVTINDGGECYVPSDIITIPLSTTEITEATTVFGNIKIYPNPTPGQFTIEMDNQIIGTLYIRIVSEQGKELFNIKHAKTTQHFKTQMDLSGQGSGMYFIEFRFEGDRVVRKIVVE